MNGILGTSATTTSDLTLLAYVFILLPGMIVGFLFARRKMFVPYHKFTMTAVTLVNWVLIGYVMLVSYSYNVAPELPDILSQLYALTATIHLVTGALAQAFATYLVILMWTERTRFEGLMPALIRIRLIKTPMRVTLALWITTVVLGLGIYFTWYAAPREDPSSLAQPGATEDPATTPESSADLAVTENATAPAVTEDVSANLAVTEDATPSPTRTRRAPATTEADARPAVTESASPCPAMTEAVDDDDDRRGDDDDSRPCPAATESPDDDNSGRGSSNSGSGSSNSGRGSSNSGSNSGSGSSNSGSGSSNSGSGKDD